MRACTDEIENLYFVGAGTHPGAGVPGVVGSAKATARLVFEDFGMDPVLSETEHDRLLAAAE